MKYKILIFLMLVALVTQAQTIKTETTTDNPNINNWLSVNLDLFDMEMPFSSTEAAVQNISFNFGTWGHLELPQLPVGINFSLRKSWFVLGALGNKNMPKHSDVQVGAHYFFKDNTRKKSLKVGLNSTSSETKNTRSTTETYVNADGRQRNQLGVRGGILNKVSGFSLDTENPTPSNIETTKYKSTGLYVGLLNRKTTNLVLDTDKYGTASTASKAVNLFVDAILPFGNSFTDIDNEDADVSDEIKTHLDGVPIGARLGYQVYQVAKRDVTGKMFGISARGELGYRPFYGPYLSASVGITLIKAQR